MNPGEPVVVVPYDAQWPAAFALLRDRVVRELGGLALNVEHVGSTAVPGLDAKPVIDMDVVVRHADDVPAAIGALARIGYEHLGDLGIAGREAFRAPDDDAPPHHLYVCAAGATELQRHLTFRDELRRDPALAQRYAALKRDLAERYRDDRDAYTEAKAAFIGGVLLDARTLEQRRRGGSR